MQRTKFYYLVIPVLTLNLILASCEYHLRAELSDDMAPIHHMVERTPSKFETHSNETEKSATAFQNKKTGTVKHINESLRNYNRERSKPTEFCKKY